MDRNRYWRSSIAQLALKHISPLVREEIVNENAFLQEYDLTSETIVVAGEIEIRRSVLFGAIRRILSGSRNVKIVDEKGRQCRIMSDDRSDVPSVVLSCGNICVKIADIELFSTDKMIRLRCFSLLSRSVNLPTSTTSYWQSILAKRALDDREVDTLMTDVDDTPIRRIQGVQRVVAQNGKLRAADLVPMSRRYFERLVGKYDGSYNIRDYAGGSGRDHIRALLEWEPHRGFLTSLRLSSHSSLTNKIDVSHWKTDEVIQDRKSVV